MEIFLPSTSAPTEMAAAHPPAAAQGYRPPSPVDASVAPAAQDRAATEADAFFRNSAYCFIALDTETTGLVPPGGIVSLSARELGGTRREFSETLINPERPIEQGATIVHRITDEHVVDAPRWPEAVGRFWAWVAEAAGSRRVVLVAHNAPFDLKMMRADNARCGLDFPRDFDVVDTLALFQDFRDAEVYDIGESCKLRDLSLRVLGKEMPDAHDALGDTQTLAHLCELPWVRTQLEKRREQHSVMRQRTTRYYSHYAVGGAVLRLPERRQGHCPPCGACRSLITSTTLIVAAAEPSCCCRPVVSPCVVSPCFPLFIRSMDTAMRA